MFVCMINMSPKNTFMSGDSRQSSDGKAGNTNYMFVARLIKQMSDLNGISLFVWLALNETRVWDVWATVTYWEQETDSFLFPNISRAASLMTVSFLHFTLSSLRLRPVISRSKGCDVTSCLVFTASDCRGNSLLTAVSGAGNMQINRVKGWCSLTRWSVWKPSQLVFKVPLE